MLRQAIRKVGTWDQQCVVIVRCGCPNGTGCIKCCPSKCISAASCLVSVCVSIFISIFIAVFKRTKFASSGCTFCSDVNTIYNPGHLIYTQSCNELFHGDSAFINIQQYPLIACLNRNEFFIGCFIGDPAAFCCIFCRIGISIILAVVGYNIFIIYFGSIVWCFSKCILFQRNFLRRCDLLFFSFVRIRFNAFAAQFFLIQFFFFVFFYGKLERV